MEDNKEQEHERLKRRFSSEKRKKRVNYEDATKENKEGNGWEHTKSINKYLIREGEDKIKRDEENRRLLW